MQTTLPLEAFVATDVRLAAKFDSHVITFDDADAFFRVLRVLLEAAKAEIEEQTGFEIDLLPVVAVSGGSIEIKIDFKFGPLSAEVRTKVRAVVLAIGLTINPSATEGEVPATSPVLSATCEETIQAAVRDAHETWKYFGKGFSAEFEATCGKAKTRSSINVPASRKLL